MYGLQVMRRKRFNALSEPGQSTFALGGLTLNVNQ